MFDSACLTSMKSPFPVPGTRGAVAGETGSSPGSVFRADSVTTSNLRSIGDWKVAEWGVVDSGYSDLCSGRILFPLF